jgi:hypothetical protein
MRQRAMSIVQSPADPVASFITRNRPIAIFLLIAYLATIPFLYRVNARQPGNCDGFLYGQVAREMLAGKRLYSQTWQDKPPLAFIPYLLPRLVGFDSYLDLGFTLGICLAIEGAIFFIYFRRELPAALAALFFLTLFPLSDPDFSWPSTEHFSSPFVALMLLMGLSIFQSKSFRAWQAAALGFLAIICLHIRQTSLFAAVLPLLAMLYSAEPPKRKVRALAILACCAAICWGAILIWIARAGDLHGYFYTVFVYPRFYARMGSITSPIHLLAALFLTHLPLIFFFSVAIAILGKYRRPVLLSLPVGMVMISLPLRGSGFAHYWVSLFPFIAIYIALAVQSPLIPLPAVRWTATLALLFAGFGTDLYQVYLIGKKNGYADLLAVDAEVQKAAPKNSTLFVCGSAETCGLVFNSRLPAADAYCFAFQLLAPQGNFLPKPLDEIFNDYLSHPPDAILVSDEYFGDMNDVSDTAPPNPVRLVRLLVHRYDYRTSPIGANFHLLVRGNK